ncbi:MAG: amphi-Trp domain-containing protein [Desulfovibrio sp.]|nr:amphi-Trp domain-containing protein [Desulfovibrio sp.]MBI4958872.1 amphi-Trp domain-containing protein [Desulfovibrio sp.]
MSKNKVKMEGVMDVKEVIAYLEDVVAGFKAGSVCMTVGEDCLTLKPRGVMDVALKVSQKKAKEKIALEVSWRRIEDASMRIGAPDEAA